MPRALESRTYSTKLLFVKTILLPLVNIYTAYPSIPSASAQAARGDGCEFTYIHTHVQV